MTPRHATSQDTTHQKHLRPALPPGAGPQGTDRGMSIMRKPFAITLDIGSSRANHTGAWRPVMEDNPFPAVGINPVERFLGDEALRRGRQAPVDAAPTGKRVLVVGAGPSGRPSPHPPGSLGDDQGTPG